VALSEEFVSALRAQFTSAELAAMRRTATVPSTLPAIGPSGTLAAMPSTQLGELADALGHMHDSAIAHGVREVKADYRAWRNRGADPYSAGWNALNFVDDNLRASVVYRAVDPSVKRRNSARKAAVTRYHRSLVTMRSDNPHYVGRSFDGTNARVRDGGVSADYRPGFAGTYGGRVTERVTGRGRGTGVFTVELHVTYEAGMPIVMRSYTDDWSGDRVRALEHARKEWAPILVRYAGLPHDIVITEAGSDPVAMHKVAEKPGDREFAAAISTSRDSKPAKTREVLANPYSGDYDEFLRAIAGGFMVAAADIRGDRRNQAYRELWAQYRAWAVREALPGHSGRVDKRWNAAVIFLGELCAAIRDSSDADAREIAEEMSAGYTLWWMTR
jgi:hypothetical protein